MRKNINSITPKNNLMSEAKYDLSPKDEIPAIKKDIETFGECVKKKDIKEVDPIILKALINEGLLPSLPDLTTMDNSE